MSMASPSFQMPGPCPCQHPRCGEIGTKLTRFGHLKGCGCFECQGRRVQRKGKKTQKRGYRALGGSAPFTPSHEEQQGTFSVEVQMESKGGAQVPRSLVRFAETDWARRAWRQAAKAIPAGVQAFPTIYAEPGGGWALLVTLIKSPRGME